MKFYLLILIFSLFTFLSSQGLNVNIYKNSSTHNSLFTENNGNDRLSTSMNDIPMPLKTIITNKESEEKELAKRIVDDYRKIFNYLDYEPVNELLTAKELAVAFDEFD